MSELPATPLTTRAAAGADDAFPLREPAPDLACEPIGSLHRALDAVHAFRPDFDDGLSNHVPMLLHAHHALGATEARRTASTQGLFARLERRATSATGTAKGAPADVADWRTLRGRRDAFEPLLASMRRKLATAPPGAVVREVVPALMPGVGGDAFHGVIRVAHAAAAGHREELAHGLAYWASVATLLRPTLPSRAGPTLAFDAWVDAVMALPRPEHPDLEWPRIDRRMRAWATSDGFDDVAAALHVGDDARSSRDALDGLAAWAAGAYAATRNFTVLHVVTASWALRLLLPWLADPLPAVRDHVRAVAAGLRAARLPRALPAFAADAAAWPSWDVLAEGAIGSTDDHRAKLVHAARQWHGWNGDSRFHAAAAAVSASRP